MWIEKIEKWILHRLLHMGGVINKPSAAAKSLAYITLLQHLDASPSWCPQTCLWRIQWYKWDQRGFSQEPYELYGPSSLDFLWNSSSPCFFFPKINIAASENRHVGCNSLSVCLLLVPNIFIKKQFPNNRATLASMPWMFSLKNCGLWETFSNSHLAI